MTHYETKLAAMHRPRTLIRAARHGATKYRRERDLKFMNGAQNSQSQSAILDNLIAYEDALETTRKLGGAEYNVARHVTVLTALIAEYRAVATVAKAA